jgi:high-affinity iron transporter
MLGAAIIVFREVIEAGLIIGIVMAATRGVAGRGRWVNIGIILGVLGAAVVAMFANRISEAFQGAGQELFNAGVLSAAVIMLMWPMPGWHATAARSPMKCAGSEQQLARARDR